MGLFKFFKNKGLLGKNKTNKVYHTLNSGILVSEPKSKVSRCLYTPENISSLASNEVFVFGSNLDGHHISGAAKTALDKFGAVNGQGVGLQGQSYAIPTMFGDIETIKPYVDDFIEFAKEHRKSFFYVTRVGCGIAGFKDEEIAPLFKKAVFLKNVSLPKTFINSISEIKIPESIRLKHYGQVRTLADIVKYLNDKHKYSSLNDLIKDFQEVVDSYKGRGTIGVYTYKRFLHCLTAFESKLFVTPFGGIKDFLQSNMFKNNTDMENSLEMYRRYSTLDISVLNEIVDGVYNCFWLEKDEDCRFELIYMKRAFAKICRIIQYLNDFRRYTSDDELMDDLRILFGGDLGACNTEHVFDDSYHYPFLFFVNGLSELWKDIAPMGTLDNDLLEKFMFEDHAMKVEELGLDFVIERDYEQDYCHKDVYFPKRVGIGPVYVRIRDGEYVKSCGEGKGPNRYPEWYEMELIKPLISTDSNYKEIEGYYIPVDDYSRPIYGNTWEHIGKIEFENEVEKHRFIEEKLRLHKS